MTYDAHVRIVYIYIEVTFTTTPENTTVCSGSDVTISCGHVIALVLPVTWIINGTSFDQEKLFFNPLYQLNNTLNPMRNSLTVFKPGARRPAAGARLVS